MSGETLGIHTKESGEPMYPKLIDISDGPEVDIGVIENVTDGLIELLALAVVPMIDDPACY